MTIVGTRFPKPHLELDTNAGVAKLTPGLLFVAFEPGVSEVARMRGIIQKIEGTIPALKGETDEFSLKPPVQDYANVYLGSARLVVSLPNDLPLLRQISESYFTADPGLNILLRDTQQIRIIEVTTTTQILAPYTTTDAVFYPSVALARLGVELRDYDDNRDGPKPFAYRPTPDGIRGAFTVIPLAYLNLQVFNDSPDRIAAATLSFGSQYLPGYIGPTQRSA